MFYASLALKLWNSALSMLTKRFTYFTAMIRSFYWEHCWQVTRIKGLTPLVIHIYYYSEVTGTNITLQLANRFYYNFKSKTAQFQEISMPFGETMSASIYQSNYNVITDAVSPPLLFSKKSQLPSDGCTSKQPFRTSNRRSRTNYTSDQLNAMEDMFSTNRYPDFNSRNALGDAIDLTEARIQVCFRYSIQHHIFKNKCFKVDILTKYFHNIILPRIKYMWM